MLILSLSAIARGPVRIRDEIPPDDPLWSGSDLVLKEPLRVDLEGRSVGDGVLVRGEIETRLETACRRCLTAVPLAIEDTVDMLFEPLSQDEALELGGEVYPLPDRGDQLDLSDPLREQLLLRVPDYVLCRDDCRGLCPHCGTDLNRGSCDCVDEAPASPWTALKNIKFE
jgi:uncharacterized protein